MTDHDNESDVLAWRHAAWCRVSTEKTRYGHPRDAICECGLADVHTRIRAREAVSISPHGLVSGPPSGRTTWWLSIIREAEDAEQMYSGDVLPDVLSVARRIEDLIKDTEK